MAAISDLNKEVSRNSELISQVIDRLNQPAGVPEAEVQSAADSLKVSNDKVDAALNPPQA